MFPAVRSILPGKRPFGPSGPPQRNGTHFVPTAEERYSPKNRIKLDDMAEKELTQDKPNKGALFGSILYIGALLGIILLSLSI